MTGKKVVNVGSVCVANFRPMVLIAGPCALESRDCALRIADELVKIADDLGIPFIFKASFDKANRTSLNARRGVSIDEGLAIFSQIKATYGCPIITDVHESSQCAVVAEAVDVLQIPAFLCRQTDLLIAAAKTGKPINVKKGQFLAPWDMENVCKKLVHSGNDNIMLCERGSCFGYNRLISDMRSLRIMGEYGYPVIFDATHSVQEPGGLGTASGGNREYIEPLTRAALAVGVAGIFLETHYDPANSISDGPNMVPLQVMKKFLTSMKRFDELAKDSNYLDMSC
ncbi:MAG: 3-deoxy-8-phosphooctulonate synthase [Holosporaceae bacterium]|jgi:2-dehydro-3-deoxyphosphooctonate aldolase (KDO 8-P synthase)|nr:3-deoxy-8-phosphooctulonate synthase [Holosporaceae bacterium]